MQLSGFSDTIRIDNIKNLNAAAGQFWFSPDTTRFFKSRYPQQAIKDGDKAYFVSSEQFDNESPRLYSVRVCDLTSGRIDTVGEFQAYKTSEDAYDAIAQIIGIK